MNRFSTNQLRDYSVPAGESETFNPVDIISGAESIDLASLQQTILSQYLPLSGGTVSNLSIGNTLYVANQAQQSFGSAQLQTLNDVNQKLSEVTFTGSKTVLNSPVDITGELSLGTRLAMNQIGLGTTTSVELSRLNGVTQPIQTTLTSLQTQLTATDAAAATLASTTSTHAGQIGTLQSTQSAHASTLGTHASAIATLDTKTTGVSYTGGVTTVSNLQTGNVDMTLLQNVTEDVQAALNTHALTLLTVEGDVANTQADITALETLTQTHTSTLQTIAYDGELHITGVANIESAVIDSLSVDGPCSIQNNNYTLYDSQFHYLSSISSDYQTTITNMTDRLDTVDNDVTTLESATSSHSTSIADHATLLQTHTDTLAQHDTDLGGLAITAANQGDNINALVSGFGAHQTTLTNMQDELDLHTGQIAQKQTQLSASNRLPVAYVGDGSVVTSEFATLAGITTSTTIQAQINSINNTLSNLDIDVDTLESLQSLDLTQFTTIGDEIIALQTHDTATDASIATIETDVSNLQTNVSDNTGRLNVYDSLTLDARVTANATAITGLETDVGTLTTTVSGHTSSLEGKQDTIDASHKLASSLVSTNVSESTSTLDVILQSLTDINTSQSTALTNVGSTIESLESQIATIDSTLGSLTTADTTHDSQIATIQGNITSLTTTVNGKQATINSSNRLAASLVFDTSYNMQQTQVNNDLYTQISNKQNAINVLNQLPIEHVDLSGSVLVNMDYSAGSLASKLTALDGEISTLTTLQSGDVTNFEAIADNFASIDTDITALQTATVNCVYLSDVTSNLQAQIDGISSGGLPSLSYDAPTITTTVADTCKVTTLKFSGDDSQQTTAFTSTIATELSTATSDITQLQSDMLTAQGDITTLQTDVSGKQDILDTSNKLPIASVDLTGSTLANMDYASSIDTKFGAIDTTLASQVTLNTSIASDITNLSTNKQNVLSSGAKLNPEYIDSNGVSFSSTKLGYLASVTSDLQTQLNGKLSSTPAAIVVDDLSVKRIYEKIDAAITSFSGNVLTVNASTAPNILYMDDLTSNANFTLALTSVPTGAYRVFTFSLWIDTTTYKGYCNSVSINGTTKTVLFNGGASAIDISTATGSTMLLQQISIFYLVSASNPDKVVSNITLFKA